METINTNETAAILGVTRQQVLLYLKKGHLKSVQYGVRGTHRINKQAVLDFKNGK